jgi:hypothetical protein
MSKRPRGKRLSGISEIVAPGKGKQERPKAGTKKKAEAASAAAAAAAAGHKTDYIHVRARRGQATDSHSLAERVILTAELLGKHLCARAPCCSWAPTDRPDLRRALELMAERTDVQVRRERISERMRYLQELVPGCSKVTGKAGMLDEIINYVQSLQKQVEVPTDRPVCLPASSSPLLPAR